MDTHVQVQFENWFAMATKDINRFDKARIKSEFEAHFYDAGADVSALEGLGNPLEVNKSLKKLYYTKSMLGIVTVCIKLVPWICLVGLIVVMLWMIFTPRTTITPALIAVSLVPLGAISGIFVPYKQFTKLYRTNVIYAMGLASVLCVGLLLAAKCGEEMACFKVAAFYAFGMLFGLADTCTTPIEVVKRVKS